MDERKLVAAFLEGEERAFRALYDLHAPSLYAFLSRLLGRHKHEADDALQDVWLRAARDLGRFRGQSSFRTWLFGIAVNRCREILRLVSPLESELNEDDLRTEPEPVGERIDLERAIARLPLRFREAVVLHDVYQHTHAEIAVLLQIDEGTSKSNLSRARARLRDFIGGPHD